MISPDPSSSSREATATIRGYIYQFDASILAILSAQPSEQVTVEGVEDVDVTSSDADTYGQVKYYEAQRLTDATVRDVIHPMLKSFLLYTATERDRKRYVLYGYFREAPAMAPTFTLADLKRLLVRASFQPGTATGGKVRTETNLQTELGASDEDLQAFCDRFTVRLSEPFDGHRERVIVQLRAALNVTKVEAEGYCYPSALTAAAALAIGASKATRTTTKAEFLQKIRPNSAIYSAWTLREEGEAAYCRKVRERHFSQLNIENRDRFFIVSLPAFDGVDDAHDLVQHIIGRWSSHKLNTKPNKERFAPFFFFPELATDNLVTLKSRLFNDGYKLTDGYPFKGAAFSASHLVSPQTKEWPISARFVATPAEFEAALAETASKKLVVQLYANEPHDINPALRQIAVPILSASMAKKIV